MQGAWLRWLSAPRPRLGREDGLLLASLAAIVLLRWTERARWLMSWDANTFAIALEDYNVRGLHPHAPGYPLYVALGRLAYAVVGDANDAYITVGLTCTIVAITGGYWLGTRLADRAAGLAVATLLAAAPLVYVHSVTANVYAADLACSVAVAALAWRSHQAPSRGRLVALGVGFAAATGVRPSIFMFLLPVAAWGALRPPWGLREQVRRLLPAAAAALAVALAWFLPMASQSGGIASWREANRLQGSQVVLSTAVWNAGWAGLQDNVGRLLLFTRWETRWVAPALLALLLLAGLAGRRASGAWRPDRATAAFLALWGLPATLFYAFVFSGWREGPSGYMLVVLPAYLLAGALVGRWALARLAARRQAVAAMAGALALLVPTVVLASHSHDVRDVQYRAHDDWADAWSHLPTSFPPSNSSIVAFYEFAHVWHAFPEYTAYNYRPPGLGPGEVPDFLLIQQARDRKATPLWYDEIAARRTAGPHPLDPGVENLVIFDFALAGENGGQRAVRDDVPILEARLDNGWRILYVQVTPDRPLLEDYFTMAGRA